MGQSRPLFMLHDKAKASAACLRRAFVAALGLVLWGWGVNAVAEPCPFEMLKTCWCPRTTCDATICEKTCVLVGGTEAACAYSCGACSCTLYASCPVPTGLRMIMEGIAVSAHAVESEIAPSEPQKGTEIHNADGDFLVISVKEAQKEAGQNAGIGVRLNLSSGSVVIAGVDAEGPASKAGLLVGDEIVSVDGRNVKGLPSDVLAQWMRGKTGTLVVLGIVGKNKKIKKVGLNRVARGSYGKPKDTGINLKKIPLKSFASKECPREAESCHFLFVEDNICIFTCKSNLGKN